MLSHNNEARRVETDAWLSWERLQRSIVGNRSPVGVKELSELIGMDYRNLTVVEKRSYAKIRHANTNKTTQYPVV